VWCTDKNLFQETTQLGLMISDIHQMLVQEDDGPDELHYMYKLR
ncbi:MAG: iron ABC transporter substrate-binding protein, partial [Clostridiales bacterium]